MTLDASQTEYRPRARDYRLAGYGPTLGSANRARMLSRGAARMAEIQAIQATHRREVETAVSQYNKNSAHFKSLAEVVATKSSYLGERFPHVDAAWARGLGGNAFLAAQDFTPMDPAIYAGVKASISPTRLAFVLPQIPHSLKTRRKKGAQYEDDEYTTALAVAMVESFKAGLGDPSDLWLYPPPDRDSDSDASEEYDPDAIPRRKMSTRVANALVIAASSIGKLEMQVDAEDDRLRREHHAPSPYAWLIMQPVFAAILDVGVNKRARECREVGPGRCGYSYIQVDDQLYLRKDLDGSTSYVGEAKRFRAEHTNKQSPPFHSTSMCKAVILRPRLTRMNTDGEPIERAWALSRPFDLPVREMQAGFRREDWNVDLETAVSWNERKQAKINKIYGKVAIVREYNLLLQYLRRKHSQTSSGVYATNQMAQRIREVERRYLGINSVKIDKEIVAAD